MHLVFDFQCNWVKFEARDEFARIAAPAASARGRPKKSASSSSILDGLNDVESAASAASAAAAENPFLTDVERHLLQSRYELNDEQKQAIEAFNESR